MYVDAAYCYRPSSVVCLSVCQSVTIMSLEKTAEPIKTSFGMWTRVGPGNHVWLDVDGGPDLPHEAAILRGMRPIVKYRDSLP